jgi:hypothetical protein
MLELRPNCECCDKDLPPESTDARICSYECTFCSNCVETILNNVCPNCGGGFVNRPIRPDKARRDGVSRQHQAASGKRVHSPYSNEEMTAFSADVKDIAPELR